MFSLCLFITVYQDLFCIVSDVILFKLFVCSLLGKIDFASKFWFDLR